MDIITWHYESKPNVFTDEDGEIIHDIFSVIRPARLAYLKRVGGVEYVYNKQRNTVYELIFEFEEED